MAQETTRHQGRSGERSCVEEAHSPLLDKPGCEREPVHAPGSIQPFGCLVAFSLPTWTIAHVSTNASLIFGVASADSLIGATMETIVAPKIIHDLRNTFQAAMISGATERLTSVAIGPEEDLYDILIHSAGQLAIAEFLPCAGADAIRADPTTLVKTIIDRLRRTNSLQAFLASAARQIRAVTGYDRVMIYKFQEDDSGVVVAEAIRAGLPPFLHLHSPASDIPAQARALFLRQWLRMIPNVDDAPVPVVPALTSKKLPLDLTLSTLRSASPIHLQYLRDMGSAATLTASIINGGGLWGLIACHHETPRRISAATCAAVELLAQVFSMQIEAKQQQDDLAAIAKARAMHDKLIAEMEPNETIFDNLRRFAVPLKEMIPCDGIGVWTGNRFDGEGTIPPQDAIEELVRMLNAKPVDRVFATHELARHLPDALRYRDLASGLLAIPFSRAPRDYLLLFRREVLQTVTWGGHPDEAGVAQGPDGALGAKASFAAWKETVRGTAPPWRHSELETAETLRISMLDVILRRANSIDGERRMAQETQLLRVAELNHRVKNLLAVICSLVRQSRQSAGSLESFTADLQARIQALSVAHDQLTLSNWRAAPLRTLIEAEAQAWTEAGDMRLVLTGPPAMIEARAYQTLALVLHEMMTNAAKYGALSVQEGRLSIEWGFDNAGDLSLRWREENGPVATPPKRRGFGSIVVEQSIPFELRGEARIDHPSEGLRADFTIPREFVRRGEALPGKIASPTVAGADLSGKNLLLVEDSLMIALDAQAMLQNCGAEVELAATTGDARRAIRLNKFDAVILDVNLYTETSYAIAEDLQALAIPFVFATGYGETIVVPDRFKDVTVISKPYVECVLRAALTA